MIIIMLYHVFVALLTIVALGDARDTGKLMKSVPTISNSLVNLGKMEISFYFNGKHPEMESKSDYSSRTEFSPPQIAEQSCPCSNFKGSGSSFLTDPTEVINKILKSNDLFKDPTSSFCCDSHEQTQDSTVFFDISSLRFPIFNTEQNSNKFSPKSPVPRPYMSLLDFATKNKGTVKPKAVEILLFPKRKDMATLEYSNLFNFNKRETPKPEIQVVGDKEPNIKLPSVKKDLALSQKKNIKEVTTIQEQMNTDAPPITNVNNTL